MNVLFWYEIQREMSSVLTFFQDLKPEFVSFNTFLQTFTLTCNILWIQNLKSKVKIETIILFLCKEAIQIMYWEGEGVDKVSSELFAIWSSDCNVVGCKKLCHRARLGFKTRFLFNIIFFIVHVEKLRSLKTFIFEVKMCYKFFERPL